MISRERVECPAPSPLTPYKMLAITDWKYIQWEVTQQTFYSTGTDKGVGSLLFDV